MSDTKVFGYINSTVKSGWMRVKKDTHTQCRIHHVRPERNHPTRQPDFPVLTSTECYDWWLHKLDLDTEPGWAATVAELNTWGQTNGDRILALKQFKKDNQLKLNEQVGIKKYTHRCFFSQLAMNFGTIGNHGTQLRLGVLSRRRGNSPTKGSGLRRARSNCFRSAVLEGRRTARLIGGARTAILQLIGYLFTQMRKRYFRIRIETAEEDHESLKFVLENLVASLRLGWLVAPCKSVY